MRILVVEDDSSVAQIISRCLRSSYYAVDLVSDGLEAEWMACETAYDVIILDRMLPRKSGLEVLTNLRAAGVTTPVLLLTACDSTADRVEGLDAGADDYLTKPFALNEVAARVRALMRRKTAYTPAVVEFGVITIDVTRREVLVKGVLLPLTAKEFAVLEYLGRNAGAVVTRTQLAEHVWNADLEPNSNVVDVYVRHLRTKLTKACGQALIKTVRGHGYLVEPMEEPSECQAPAEDHSQPRSVASHDR